MSFFSKKQNDELFFLLEKEEPKIQINTDKENIPHPSVLTPEEIIDFSSPKSANIGNSSALDSLKSRMTSQESLPDADSIPLTKTIKSIIDDKENQKKADASSFNTPTVRPHTEKVAPKEETEPKKQTLLEKCLPYIVDNNGKSTVSKDPAYKLQSVAEILTSESQKTIEKLSSHYDITFDDLGKSTTSDKKDTEYKYNTYEKDVYEEKLPPSHRPVKYQTNVASIISDIDNSSTEPKEKPEATTSTIKFTPVDDTGNVPVLSVSSQTRSIDLTGELTQLSNQDEPEKKKEVTLEQTEFEEYIPDDEFKTEADSKHLLRIFSIKKRNHFISSFASIFLTLLLCVMKLPFMSGTILSNTKICMIICTSIMGIIILINIGMFKGFSRIFKARSTPDVNAAIASVFVLAYSIAGILLDEITLELTILLSVILSARSLFVFFKDSYMLSNFKQISAHSPKRAVKLIGDQAVTFAMAKNSIDGNVLTAAPQRTEHIDDFMKYSTFSVFMNGKLPVITVVSVILSVIVGFACYSFFDGIIYGFFGAAVIQLFTSVPVLFMVDCLPLYSSSKKLNKIGGMISGKAGAQQIENANSVVFSSNELFPSGTVTLHHMTVLAENSVDDTIIRAASLTESLKSPLCNIFKIIAGGASAPALPDSDSVKYEDKMGISGWVDNKLLFIGNRTLLEAHGIDVPDVDLDRKILRQGFFPVYVATENKACVLLVVQYSVRPEISKEMKRISSLGITMLIDSSDPNMTEEMITDYMGLYSDSVKVMSSAGSHMYNNAVSYTAHISAPAACKSNPLALASIITSASKIKKSNTLLTILYILTSVLGIIMFAYMSFNGTGTLVTGTTVLVFSLISTLVSFLLYLAFKP